MSLNDINVFKEEEHKLEEEFERLKNESYSREDNEHLDAEERGVMDVNLTELK